MKNAVPPLTAFIALMLTACGRTGEGYPSLALRPAEARGFAEPEAPAAAPVAADAALDARVAEARQSLARIARGFDRSAIAARAAAGRSGARTAGSDAWLDGQTALAMLDDWRAQASAAAADVDTLASTRAAALRPAYPEVETLRTAAAAEVARQDAAIRGLAAALPGG